MEVSDSSTVRVGGTRVSLEMEEIEVYPQCRTIELQYNLIEWIFMDLETMCLFLSPSATRKRLAIRRQM